MTYDPIMKDNVVAEALTLGEVSCHVLKLLRHVCEETHIRRN